jgi:hypothetical protein
VQSVVSQQTITCAAGFALLPIAEGMNRDTRERLIIAKKDVGDRLELLKAVAMKLRHLESDASSCNIRGGWCDLWVADGLGADKTHSNESVRESMSAVHVLDKGLEWRRSQS